jgi:DNA-binding NarL/FixJ family response regulator
VRRLRVVIVDYHRMVVDGLVRFLGDSCDVVATLDDGALVRETIRRLTPDIAILDIAMPRTSGLEVLRQLAEDRSACRVIVLTMYAEARLVVDALKAGASGFVLKESSADELLSALHVVQNGGTYLPKHLTKEIVTLMVGVDGRGAQLSPLKREVLRLLVQGLRPKQIAATLDMTTRSVETVKYRVMRELDVHSTAELVRRAIEQRLLSF